MNDWVEFKQGHKIRYVTNNTSKIIVKEIGSTA